MILNEWYTFYFENRGKCPECGRWLIPYFGCIGVIAGERKKAECSIRKLSFQSYDRVKVNYKEPRGLTRAFINKFKYKNERNRKNLDIQRKKTYIKTDD